MTTLEMLNASAKEPDVKFWCVSPCCYSETYCIGGKFRYDYTTPPAHGFDANLLMQLKWAPETPKPLSADVECVLKFDGDGALCSVLDLANTIRQGVGGKQGAYNEVRHKTFKLTGRVDEVIE